MISGFGLLAACRSQVGTSSDDRPTPESLIQREALPTASAAPTTVPPVEATAVSPPTITPSPTAKPGLYVYAPDYLEHQVLSAIGELASGDTSWRWELTRSKEQADIVLVPGDQGIPAGSRALALTVPFDADLDGIAASQADSLVNAGREDILTMDWAAIPPERKALRLDGLLPNEEGYPLKQDWSLLARPSYETAANELALHLRRTIHQDRLIQLTAVGDLMLDRALGYALQNGDLTFPFAAVSHLLNSGDITVGNLESALGDRGQPMAKSYTFRAPPEAAEALARAGFDVLSLANNHALDYGPEALEQAMLLLGQRDVATVGAGPNIAAARAPVTVEMEGLSVAFLGYVDVPVEVGGFDTRSWSATEEGPGLAWAEIAHIQEDVVAARLESDLVVVLLHSGYEYVQAPSPEQSNAARAAIDAGADLVLGHHAHVLQGIEFRSDAAIIYGLGNFAFEIDGDPTTMIVNVWLDSDGVRQIEIIPAIIQAGGQPRPAAPWEAFEIRQRVYSLSNLLRGAP